MEFIIDNQLSEVFEIARLMYYSYHPEELTHEKFMEHSLKLGISSSGLVEETVSSVLKPMNKYLAAFQKQMVKSESDLFFFENSGSLSLAFKYVNLLTKHKDWLVTTEHLDEDLIYSELAIQLLDEVPDTIQEIMRLLRESGVEAAVAWKCLLMLENPKQYLNVFIQIINQNLPAYSAGVKEMQTIMAPLMEKFPQHPYQFFKGFIPFFENETEEKVKIIPTLIDIAGAIGPSKGPLYVGLRFHEVIQLIENQDYVQEDLPPLLKVLGDSSKLEILKFLKQAPSYNLEIAKHMKLTPATTSHHMTILLTKKLVTCERRNKKAYYSINQNKIREITASLEAMLL